MQQRSDDRQYREERRSSLRQPTADCCGGRARSPEAWTFCVGVQTDGDLMYAPGALWTAVHHRIPMLLVMRNNRAYHQEVMHIQRMANWRQRGITNAGIGNVITDPNIDYATLVRGMGVYSEGPITNPNDLGAALERAVERVELGETALVDVVTQPR